MNPTHRNSHRRTSIALLAIATLSCAAAASATEVPATTAYHFSSHPMISGTVRVVDDHEMVVDTDQGEQVTLQLDSRTMAPRDLSPGMMTRTEFVAVPDCQLYAQRVTIVRDGMPLHREQAYANTRDTEVPLAQLQASPAPMAGSAPTLNDYAPATRASMAVWHASNASLDATPATADYIHSTRPLLSGTVISVNDHALVMHTDQGKQIGMVMDSRTMVPAELSIGRAARVEFRRLKDGRYYASRVTSVDGAIAPREQAYAQTRDADIELAGNVTDWGCASMTAARSTTTTSMLDGGGTDAVMAQMTGASDPGMQQPMGTAASSAPPASTTEPPADETQSTGGEESLPQTGSGRPMMVLAGSIALAIAAGFKLSRGRGAA